MFSERMPCLSTPQVRRHDFAGNFDHPVGRFGGLLAVGLRPGDVGVVRPSQLLYSPAISPWVDFHFTWVSLF